MPQKQHNKIMKLHLPFFLFFALLLPYSSYSQKKIEILNAGSLRFDKNLGFGAKRLIGNVELKQENTLMFCDSAYFYENNSLDAFGHVHIQQNDSIHLYGDSLHYIGNTKKAILKSNVIVNKGDMQLTTDILNYDVSTSVGYYTTSARIDNKDNVLTSKQGYFFAKKNELNFKKDVVLTSSNKKDESEKFVVNSDTMRYNTSSKITYFLGPTTIKSKENMIYCEDGWYDTFNDLSRFSKNSYILTKEQKMFGDSLYYDRKKGVGRAVKNVQIIDTTQNINIKGDYAIHNELKDLSIVTGNALLTQIYDKDTLYLHADTLEAVGDLDIEKPETKSEKPKDTGNPAPLVLSHPEAPTTINATPFIKIDSLQRKQPDSTHRAHPTSNIQHPTDNQQRIFAYHKVKFFKNDLQGKCDSLSYETADSTMKLYGQPTLWSDQTQLTGDSIYVVIGDKSIKTIEMFSNGFMVSEEDSLRYNQIRGKNIKGFFKDNDLYRVNVTGNGQTIYYAKDKEEIKAVNRADCSDLSIYFKDKKVEHITFITKPDATLFPLDKIDIKDLQLKDFTWRAHDRPLTMKDIFVW